MYPNLVKELRNRNITNKMLASVLNISEKSAYNKTSGQNDFLLGEGMLIHDVLLPEFEMEYLYRRNDEPAQDEE